MVEYFWTHFPLEKLETSVSSKIIMLRYVVYVAIAESPEPVWTTDR